MAIFSTKAAAVKPKAPSLSADEARRLTILEAAVEAGLPHVKAMVDAGKALAEIRDRELYRAQAATFAGYLHDRWGMTPRRACQVIQFAGIVAVVEEIVGDDAPTLTERAVRPLAGLDADDMRDAIVEAAADGMTPAAITKAASKRRKKRGSSRPPRPVRLKLPGGIVIVEINRKGAATGATVEALLAAAVEAVRRQAAA